jgi:ribosomal protein S18 acetylase RimI-like enzyme
MLAASKWRASIVAPARTLDAAMKARNITLRLAHVGDARTIAELSRDLIEHGLGWSWTRERVARNLSNPDTSAVVACESERLIGFAIMYFGDEAAHLNLLAVRSEYQRAGVGRRMFEWLRASALVAGIAVVRLELRAANRPGRAFYASLGFDETGHVPYYYSGREAALRMALRLRGGPQAP